MHKQLTNIAKSLLAKVAKGDGDTSRQLSETYYNQEGELIMRGGIPFEILNKASR